MRPIPKKLLKEILEDPYYEICIRDNCDCKGRITLEHALYYARKQINEKFAILPVCEFHHKVGIFQNNGDLDKRFHEYIAIGRMTKEDVAKYPKLNWAQRFSYLSSIYNPNNY